MLEKTSKEDTEIKNQFILSLNNDNENEYDNEDEDDNEDEYEEFEEITNRVIKIYDNLLNYRDKLEMPLLEHITIDDFNIFIENILDEKFNILR